MWSEGSVAGVEFDHPLHGEVFQSLVRDYARSRHTFDAPPTSSASIAA